MFFRLFSRLAIPLRLYLLAATRSYSTSRYEHVGLFGQAAYGTRDRRHEVCASECLPRVHVPTRGDIRWRYECMFVRAIYVCIFECVYVSVDIRVTPSTAYIDRTHDRCWGTGYVVTTSARRV